MSEPRSAPGSIEPHGNPGNPGTKTWLRQTFKAANGHTFTVSIGVIRGAKPGPICTHIGGQHGMEHTGPIVLRDVFNEIDPADLCGTLYICPCANPPALVLDYEVYPEQVEHEQLMRDGVDGKALGFGKREDLGELNMNRLWPRGDDGVAGQVVRWLWQTAVEPADVVVDHHAVRCALKPYIFAEAEVTDWTPLLGMECVWCTGPVVANADDYPYRRLCMQAIRVGKVGMCIEYATQHMIMEDDRPIGRFAVMNLCRALGMLPGEVVIRKPVWLIEGPYWENSVEVTSKAIGHPHYVVEEYELLKKGQLIARVYCPQTNELLDEVVSPCDGLMLNRNPMAMHIPGGKKDWICRVGVNVRLLAEPGKPYTVPALKSRELAANERE